MASQSDGCNCDDGHADLAANIFLRLHIAHARDLSLKHVEKPTGTRILPVKLWLGAPGSSPFQTVSFVIDQYFLMSFLLCGCEGRQDITGMKNQTSRDAM